MGILFVMDAFLGPLIRISMVRETLKSYYLSIFFIDRTLIMIG